MLFDNGDLVDFTLSASEDVSGKIHIDGNIYMRPYDTAGAPNTAQRLRLEHPAPSARFGPTVPLRPVFWGTLVGGHRREVVDHHQLAIGGPEQVQPLAENLVVAFTVADRQQVERARPLVKRLS